jgi:hypothetical protein
MRKFMSRFACVSLIFATLGAVGCTGDPDLFPEGTNTTVTEVKVPANTSRKVVRITTNDKPVIVRAIVDEVAAPALTAAPAAPAPPAAPAATPAPAEATTKTAPAPPVKK